jgi:hypothetical protein
VGRYHLEDYGAHDIIVEDDVLTRRTTTARVASWTSRASCSGNLYDQGREIAVFKPYDPKGFTANAPFVMNAMPGRAIPASPTSTAASGPPSSSR